MSYYYYFCLQLTALCECDVTNIGFSAGSIVVVFTLSIAEDTAPSVILSTLEQAAIDGSLIAGYDVDADDVTFGATAGGTHQKFFVFC